MEAIKKMAIEQGAQFFIKEVKGKQIAAIAIMPASNPALKKQHIAYFGFYYFDLQYKDEAKKILKQAINYATKQGFKELRGPININQWFNFRLKTDQHSNNCDFLWEPSNPPEYYKLLEQLNFTPVDQFYTAAFDDFSLLLQQAKTMEKRITAQGYTIRPINLDNFEYELKLLYTLSQSSFATAPYFAPITFEQFSTIYTLDRDRFDFSYSAFVCDPNGQEIAYSFAFPQEELLVLKSTAVLPEYRHQGIALASLHYPLARATSEQYEGIIIALAEKSIITKAEEMMQSAIWDHLYTLYKLSDLSGAGN